MVSHAVLGGAKGAQYVVELPSKPRCWLLCLNSASVTARQGGLNGDDVPNGRLLVSRLWRSGEEDACSLLDEQCRHDRSCGRLNHTARWRMPSISAQSKPQLSVTFD